MRGLTKKEKTFIQYAFLLLLISFTIYLVSTTLDTKLIPKIIALINLKYIILGLLLVSMYILFEAIIINLIVNSIEKTKVKCIGFKLATMGMYYNLVTPFASGSQPMQVYALMKNNVGLSKSIAIITNKTVIFQSIVTIYSALLVSMNIDLLSREMSSIMILVIIGIAMNITMLAGGLLIVLSPKKVKIILNFLVDKLTKFKIFRFLDCKREELNNYVDEYNYSIRVFIKDKKVLLMSILLTIIQLTIFFSLVYCVYKAFNLTGVSYLKMVTLQVFLYICISPIPTPGNIGANELAFLTIFTDIFPKELIGYGVFLYGGFVYYFMIIICGIFTIHTHYKFGKSENEKIKNKN